MLCLIIQTDITASMGAKLASGYLIISVLAFTELENMAFVIFPAAARFYRRLRLRLRARNY